MEVENDEFVMPILWPKKLLVKIMVCLFTLCLIMPTFSLVQVFFRSKIPSYFLQPTIETLFDGLNLIVILAIGYELVKSLIITSSHNIFTIYIAHITIFAISFKMIALDIKHTAPQLFMVLVVIMLSLGVTYFLYKGKNNKSCRFAGY
jgi:hypothetical protein